jgi:hypothetical protein
VPESARTEVRTLTEFLSPLGHDARTGPGRSSASAPGWPGRGGPSGGEHREPGAVPGSALQSAWCKPYSDPFSPFDAPNARRQIRAEQPHVGGLETELTRHIEQVCSSNQTWIAAERRCYQKLGRTAEPSSL